MNSTLQDIMGLLKRYAVKTPTDADYMVIAGHTSRGVLVPQPGLEPNVITVGGLKDHILSSAIIPTLQDVVTAGSSVSDSTIYLAMDPYISNPVLVISGDNVPIGLINITMNDGACINAFANDGTTIVAGSLDGTALGAISNEGTAISAQSTGTNGTALNVNSSYRGITVANGGISILGTAHGTTTYQLSLSANSAAKPSTNTWTVTSDSRIKTNVNPYTKGLETILAINPITYDYNGKAGFDSTITNNIGIIAQDVINIIPESINTYNALLNEDDEKKTELYNFDSHALTFILINAVKQLNERIELLETQLKNK